MYKPNYFLVLLMVLSVTACSEAPPPPSCCNQPWQFVLFTDVEVPERSESTDDVLEANAKKFATLTFEIESNFFQFEKWCPIQIAYYPIYYGTFNNDSEAQFLPLSNNWCSMTQQERADVSGSYLVSAQFDEFQKNKVQNDNRRYRQVWPIIRSITREINKSEADTIIVIVYSDLVEYWPNADNEDGSYNFYGGHHFTSPPSARKSLDQFTVQKAISDLRDTSTLIGATAVECRQAVAKAAEQKRIMTYLLLDTPPNNLNTNILGGKNLLQSYGDSLLHSIGLTPEPQSNLREIFTVLNKTRNQ